jgi:nicotinate dehydrogenase subunit B
MIPNALPKSLADNPRLDQWIGFEDGGRVRVATGKVELGQGILTALAQIAAEELDVSMAQLRLISGETPATPNEIFTAGSMSIEGGGAALRLVCAQVRALFLERAAALLGADAASLAMEDGAILQDGAPTGMSYWSLAADIDLSHDATGAAPTKKPSEYRVVGKAVPRVDLAAKIADAAFIHDILPDGVLHARVIRQPWPGARLAGVDEARLNRPRGDIAALRVGEFLAVTSSNEAAVVAATEMAASAFTWEGGTPPPDDAGEPGWLMRQATQDRELKGEGAPAPQGERTLTALYSRPYIAHASIGPSCALALFADGHLTVYTHSQGVFPLRSSIARALQMDVADISVLHRPGAGCYGHNGADDVAFDAALIATQTPGRFVRVLWSRADELAASPVGAAMAVKLSAGLGADGRPAGWTVEIWSPTHAQRPGMGGGINLLGALALPDQPPHKTMDVPDANGGGGVRNALALYDLPGQRIIHHFIPDCPVRTSALRTLGAYANAFAIEGFIDELAAEAGRDPVAYRLDLLSDVRARAVIEKAAAMAGWSEGDPLGEGRAKGIGFSRYKNKAAWCACVAEVAVEEEVRLLKVWCAVDGGLIINPDGARNQIEGGIIQGASWTLKEEVRIADGRIATRAWADYPILRFSEVPEIEIALIPQPNEPALGMGEVAHGPVAAAIGNSVARALGMRLRRLPLSRERLMAAMLGDS